MYLFCFYAWSALTLPVSSDARRKVKEADGTVAGWEGYILEFHWPDSEHLNLVSATKNHGLSEQVPEDVKPCWGGDACQDKRHGGAIYAPQASSVPVTSSHIRNRQVLPWLQNRRCVGRSREKISHEWGVIRNKLPENWEEIGPR